MKIVGKILKYLVYALIVFVFGLIFWRIWTINNESNLGEITPTANAVSAYTSSGEEAFMTNDMNDRISGTQDGADGYFSAYAFVYIPEKKELQVTVRVNESTFEKMGIGEMPYFYLNIYENSEDVRDIREPSYTEETEMLMYRYRRLIFEDVEIGESNDILICASDSGDSSADKSQLVVHFKEQILEQYELSKDEKKFLETADSIVYGG